MQGEHSTPPAHRPNRSGASTRPLWPDWGRADFHYDLQHGLRACRDVEQAGARELTALRIAEKGSFLGLRYRFSLRSTVLLSLLVSFFASERKKYTQD